MANALRSSRYALRPMGRAKNHSFRLPPGLAQQLEREAQHRQLSAAALVRETLERAFADPDGASAAEAIEARIAATLDRQARELARLQRSQQVTLALLDGLARALFVRLEDPQPEQFAARRSVAQANYERLIKQVGRELASPGATTALTLSDSPAANIPEALAHAGHALA